MLDSLRKLKVSVSTDSQQISDKSCVEWTGIDILFRQYMRLNDRDKSVIRTAIQEMLNNR